MSDVRGDDDDDDDDDDGGGDASGWGWTMCYTWQYMMIESGRAGQRVLCRGCGQSDGTFKTPRGSPLAARNHVCNAGTGPLMSNRDQKASF